MYVLLHHAPNANEWLRGRFDSPQPRNRRMQLPWVVGGLHLAAFFFFCKLVPRDARWERCAMRLSAPRSSSLSSVCVVEGMLTGWPRDDGDWRAQASPSNICIVSVVPWLTFLALSAGTTWPAPFHGVVCGRHAVWVLPTLSTCRSFATGPPQGQVGQWSRSR